MGQTITEKIFAAHLRDTPTPGNMVRITSYNVCYTKLLRLFDEFTVVKPTANQVTVPLFGNMDHHQIEFTRLEGLETDHRILEIVITSYSIHYTKLYDLTTLGPVRNM